MTDLDLIGKYGGAGAIILVVVVGFFRSALGRPVLARLTRAQAAMVVASTLAATLVLGLFALHRVTVPPAPTPTAAPAIVTHGANSPVVNGVGGNVDIKIDGKAARP